ncbi:hypothetical protein ACN47E_007363 [Coniothyrium glycines]
MPIDAALRRADAFITEQLHKFEQQRKGHQSPPRAYSGYGQIHDPRQGRPPSQGPPPQHQDGHTPPGSHLPQGWRQEFDHQSQRWYYIDSASGRSQWEPPSYGHPTRAQTFANNRSSRFDDDRRRGRAVSQPQRPVSSSDGGQYLNPQANTGRQDMSVSQHPSTHGRLPPGAHLDMSTGQVVSNMFPPGQSPAQWAQEVGRV